MLSLHLRHRQSRCHARCDQGPPGTCLQPPRGTHTHDTQSQTNCRSLVFKDKATRHINETFLGPVVKRVSCSKWSSLTLFAVWLSILQVEGVVSDWPLTAGTQKAVDVPCLFEGIYHLLWTNNMVNSMVSWRLPTVQCIGSTAKQMLTDIVTFEKMLIIWWLTIKFYSQPLSGYSPLFLYDAVKHYISLSCGATWPGLK